MSKYQKMVHIHIYKLQTSLQIPIHGDIGFSAKGLLGYNFVWDRVQVWQQNGFEKLIFKLKHKNWLVNAWVLVYYPEYTQDVNSVWYKKKTKQKKKTVCLSTIGYN